MQRHNVSRGCNSLQLLFKIYCSLIAGFLSLPGGFSVEIGSLFQVCICECVDNAKVTSDQLVPCCENTSDAFKRQEADPQNSSCTVLIILQSYSRNVENCIHPITHLLL